MNQEAARVARAVFDVFGEDEAHRSESQKLVWAFLEQAAYVKRPSFVPDKDGHLCPIRAAVTDGRRGLFLEIQSILEAGMGEADAEITVTK